MIKSVEMINWRAYEQHKVEFSDGITFIMGANGSGKTSILEAIAYGLTGEPSTVMDRKKLLRDLGTPAIVKLVFEVEDQSYLVERSQSFQKAEGATVVRIGDRKQLGSSHKHVTTQIERLMNVSADFLQRIIYMAEGDVFRFLSQPSGKALDLQIRHILGLTQLDEFIAALGIAEKDLKQRATRFQQVTDRSEALGITKDVEFERHLQSTDARRRHLLDELRSIQDARSHYLRENDDLLHLAPLLESAYLVLEHSDHIRELAQQKSVVVLFAELERKAQALQERLEETQTAIARLEGEETAYQRILNILLPYVGRSETLPCPVCNKPMTADERDCIIQDIQANLDQITQARRRLLEAHNQGNNQYQQSLGQVNSLRELRNYLAHVRVEAIGPDTDISREHI